MTTKLLTKLPVVIVEMLVPVVAFLFLHHHAQAQRAPNKQDIEWACHLGSPHKCQCPDMVAEVTKEYIAKCQAGSPVDYDDCMAHMPEACHIVQQADKKHPEHTCKRNCTMAVCRCNDEAQICTGDTLVH